MDNNEKREWENCPVAMTEDVRAIETAVLSPGPTRLEQLQAIVTEHQAMKVDGHLVDACTANMLVKVVLALNEKNRTKFLGLTITKMVDVGWKLVN